MRGPTAVSLFAGCGGSSLGYRLAGFKVLLAVEWDPHACQTYHDNLPGTPVWEGDIKRLKSDEALKLAGVRPGELDVLDGSPPCQGFSTAGKRRKADKRNFLFREYARLLRAFRPRAFVVENVPGLVRGEMRPIFREIFRTLRLCGYDVSVRLLNAWWYGVPQSRERVFFVGVRRDLGLKPSHPPPSVKRAVTAGEAIQGIPAGKTTRFLKEPMLSAWRRCRPGQQFSKHHPKGWWFNASKLNPLKPCPTITHSIYVGASGQYHWKWPRLLNGAELKRLSSFPDSFRIEGGWKDVYARVGNSVPPLLARAVSSHVLGILRGENA